MKPEEVEMESLVTVQKQRESRYDPYAEEIRDWFVDNVTLKEAVQRLKKLGCAAKISSLSKWWHTERDRLLRAQVIGTIAGAAQVCRAVESELGENPAPELETLIKLHRVLIMQLSASGKVDLETVRLVSAMMKPVMAWAMLQERRKSRRLAEARFKESLRSKLEAGLRALAQYIKGSPAAQAAFDTFKETVAKATQ